MIMVVDERVTVKDGFVSLFDRIGVSAAGLGVSEFRSWIQSTAASDVRAVDAFLVGECGDRGPLSRSIRDRSSAAVIAISDGKSLADTLAMLDAGYDDVVRKPIHVSEILARIKAIRRRSKPATDVNGTERLHIFADGRDPEVDGESLSLPRRERCILEFLVANSGCWVTKTQIFNSVYGLFSDEIDETVVECHVSRLRKRLRPRLGYDPIRSQRFHGYCFAGRRRDGAQS